MLLAFPLTSSSVSAARREKDFEQTVSLLAEVEYDQVFSFKFSPRPNTAALEFVDTVAEEEKGRRLAVLQEAQRQIQLRRNQELVGRRSKFSWKATSPLGAGRGADHQQPRPQLSG